MSFDIYIYWSFRKLFKERELKKTPYINEMVKHDNGPYSLLICASYFIFCSVYIQFASIILSFANGTGGIGIFLTFCISVVVAN